MPRVVSGSVSLGLCLGGSIAYLCQSVSECAAMCPDGIPQPQPQEEEEKEVRGAALGSLAVVSPLNSKCQVISRRVF